LARAKGREGEGESGRRGEREKGRVGEGESGRKGEGERDTTTPRVRSCGKFELVMEGNQDA